MLTLHKEVSLVHGRDHTPTCEICAACGFASVCLAAFTSLHHRWC